MTEQSLGRLLIVDDESELNATLCETLSLQGYHTVGFTSGEQAVQALKEQDFDLLLTDLMMPGMDGIELLRAGLGIDPHLVGIVMTGYGTVQTAVDAMKVGAFDYILKPFKLREMLPVLTRAMTLRRLRLENVQLRETAAMHELTQALATTLDLNAILNKVVDAALQQAGADEASILLPTARGDEFTVAAVRGAQRDHLLGQVVPREGSIVGWVANRCEPLLLHGAIQDTRFAPLQARAAIASAMSLPLQAGGKLVGVLNVNATTSLRPFTQGQLKALALLAGSVAFAIENARLFESLERARAEAEEASRAKDEFLAIVSHELRTPLTSIVTWSHMLREAQHDDPTLARGLEVIERNAKAQTHLVNDLLDVSSITTGKLTFQGRPTDLQPIVASVIESVRPSAEAKQISLRATLDAGVGLVHGDEKRLHQIVWNLLSNAVKFTPSGGSIEVEMARDGDSIRLEVGDNGQGIPAEFLPYIFDRFRQADASSTRQHGGLGLGLSIVRHLVDLHGGTITGESDGPGQGARFILRLPVAAGAESEEAPK